MSNINRNDENYAENGLPNNPDPIIQARDESDNYSENIQTVDAALATRRVMPLADSSFSHGSYTNGRNHDKTAWTASYIFKSTLRYKWTFMLIFVLIAAPLLAFIWTQIVPKYQARAEIRVSPIIPYIVYETENSGMIPLYSSFLNTQVSIIRSMTVLQRVLEQPDISATNWYKKPNESFFSKITGNNMSAMERLRDNLSVRPRNKTEIIDISFIAENANDAKDIVNAVLDEYLKYVEKKSDETDDLIYAQLLEQEGNLKLDIQGTEDLIQQRLKALGTSSPDELIASKKNNIEEIMHTLIQVQQNIDLLVWEKNKINELIEKNKNSENSDNNDVIVELSEKRQYHNDSEWRALNIDIRKIQHGIDTSQYAENHPEMERLRKDLEFAKELLALRESQIDDQIKNMPDNATSFSVDSGQNYEERLSVIEYQIERAQKEEEVLDGNLKDLQEEFDIVFKTAQSIKEDTNKLAYTRDKYERVRQRLDQKNMEKNVPASINILTSAFVPSKYYNDRRLVFSIMSLCVAIGLGFGVAFLRANMNQVIFASRDMPLPAKVPHLGSIPLIRLKNPLGKMLGEEIEKNHIQLFESVRVIRTKLLLQLNNQSSSTLLISSSVAGTGKSSFIKVLGKCIAKTGKSVLMVDTDFYKRTLSKRFGLLDKPGIINYLNTKSMDFSGICKTEVPNLDILPAGKHTSESNMFEGIDNGFFGTYLGELRKRYSVIILDSSPVLPRADTVIMSHHVNGVIMVERELLSRREEMITSLDRINSSGGNIWGVVFVSSSDFETYSGYYSGYYETLKD